MKTSKNSVIIETPLRFTSPVGKIKSLLPLLTHSGGHQRVLSVPNSPQNSQANGGQQMFVQQVRHIQPGQFHGNQMVQMVNQNGQIIQPPQGQMNPKHGMAGQIPPGTQMVDQARVTGSALNF